MNDGTKHYKFEALVKTADDIDETVKLSGHANDASLDLYSSVDKRINNYFLEDMKKCWDNSGELQESKKNAEFYLPQG